MNFVSASTYVNVEALMRYSYDPLDNTTFKEDIFSLNKSPKINRKIYNVFPKDAGVPPNLKLI